MRRLAISTAVLLTWGAICFAQQAMVSNRSAIARPAVQAESIVVGKVGELETETVKAASAPGSNIQVEYQVAPIQIADSLTGAKGLTVVRVGFISNTDAATTTTPPVAGGLGARRVVGRNVRLTPGQEGCFFLVKHHEADFYIMAPGQPLVKANPDYEKDLELIKKIMAVCDKPMDALKAKDAADRQFAACVLVYRYRSLTRLNGRVAKQEAINAEESKLILKELASPEWKAETPFPLASTISILGLTPKEGWKIPQIMPGDDMNKVYGEAYIKWHKESGDKFHIQRYVMEK